MLPNEMNPVFYILTLSQSKVEVTVAYSYGLVTAKVYIQ